MLAKKLLSSLGPSFPVKIQTGVTSAIQVGYADSSSMYAVSGTTLWSYDVSEPLEPSLLDTFTMANAQLIIGVSGNYLFTRNTATPSVVYSYDISTPSNISLADSLTLSYKHEGARIDGNYVYFVSTDGIESVNISSPTSMSVADTLANTADFARRESFFIYGNSLVTIQSDFSGNEDYEVWDISNPSSLALDWEDVSFTTSGSGIQYATSTVALVIGPGSSNGYVYSAYDVDVSAESLAYNHGLSSPGDDHGIDPADSIILSVFDGSDMYIMVAENVSSFYQYYLVRYDLSDPDPANWSYVGKMAVGEPSDTPYYFGLFRFAVANGLLFLGVGASLNNAPDAGTIYIYDLSMVA